jgi:hypothetical protein
MQMRPNQGHDHENLIDYSWACLSRIAPASHVHIMIGVFSGETSASFRSRGALLAIRMV